ncbi:MAG TPA: Dabb family protein [Selenomonadales bacterium]|nr:Dabb family protein [Selenomonadales bacterium]
MINHNLLLKLQDRSSENVADTRDLLMSMREKIEVIRDLKVKEDIRHAESSWDIALIARFDTMADFQAYLPHPAHVAVAGQLKNRVAAMAAVCFED